VYTRGCPRCSGLLLTMPETTASAVLPPPAPPEAPHTGAPTQATTPLRRGPNRDGPRPLRLGRYVIRHLVGKGGFGAVYAAYDEELDRLVAVKVPYARRLAPGEQQQAFAEARRHAKLDHPNIVPIYDVGRTDEIPCYFVSKLIAGRDLAERLKESRPGYREAAALLLPVAEALAHLHGRGLIHRDVKPRNILLDEAGVPYLADFGLAMPPLPPEGSADEQLLAGTLAYMSPEQARGENRQLDGRSDLYALGVVLYELLTGERPFTGGVVTVRTRILQEEPTPPHLLDPGVPRDLEAVCLKLLAKDPAQRYQHADELAEDLRRFLAGEPLRYGRKTGMSERVLSWLRRHRAVSAAAAVAGVAVMLALLLAMRRPPPREVPVLVEREKTVRATVQTRPSGAAVSFFPLDGETGEVRPDKVVRARAGDVVDVVPGYNLVVAVLEGKPGETVRFHEVLRLVPGSKARLTGPFRFQEAKYRDGVWHLFDITIPPADVTREMCLVPGAEEFVMGSDELKLEGQLALAPPHRHSMPAFYLDTTEVTVRAYNQAVVGDDMRQHPPAVGEPNHPVTSVRWDQAVSWAEKIGKRLPDEAEYEYAATACGKQRYPWGNDLPEPLGKKQWRFGPVGEPGYDALKLPGQPVVYGLYSNAAEWTSSWVGGYPGLEPAEAEPKLRVIRGGPFSVVEGRTELSGVLGGPRERFSLVIPVNRPGLGFRCVRSAKPRWNAEEFGHVLGR
jgi:formylglycine-generating enzyme required for sulfatase activity